MMTTIRERLDDEKVVEIIHSLDDYLMRLKPDGKKVHRVGNLRYNILLKEEIFYKTFGKGDAINMNFLDLSKINTRLYNKFLGYVDEAISTYGFKF